MALREYFIGFAAALVLVNAYWMYIVHHDEHYFGLEGGMSYRRRNISSNSNSDNEHHSPAKALHGLKREQERLQQIERQLQERPPLPKNPLRGDRQNFTCSTSPKKTRTFPQEPSLVIIGVQKGGTSALSNMLDFHPQLRSAPWFEPHFFDFHKTMQQYKNHLDGPPKYACRILQAYLKHLFRNQTLRLERLFSHPDRFVFEKTPAYIVTDDAPHRIKRVAPWAKIVVALRNPVDRLVSSHRMTVRRKWEFRNLVENLAEDVNVLRHAGYWVPQDVDGLFHNVSDAAGYHVRPRNRKLNRHKTETMLYRGMYARQLVPWLEYYTIGKDLHVVRFEELKAKPQKVLNELVQFMGAPAWDFPDEIWNKSYSPNRKGVWIQYTPHVTNETLSYLKRFYKPYNSELVELLGESWRGVWDD